MHRSKTSKVNRKRMIYETSELEFRIYLFRRKVLGASYTLGRQPACSSPTVREGASTKRYALAYARATAPFRLSRPSQRRHNLFQHVRLRSVSLQHRIFFAFAVSQLMIFDVT